MIDATIILGRSEIPLPKKQEMDYYRGKTVLVTGGGGSVGGVLVRMLARRRCSNVVVFDINENGAYRLCLQLQAEYPETHFFVEIGSVRDKRRLDAVFEKYKPHTLFHAAAHKHVSLMEENCAEAVKNNCMGTLNCILSAEKYYCRKFVLISTDKAVRPTGVMGATKRVCEMLALRRKCTGTEFCAVRFGNVFGSDGSVVPIFEDQIARGGPVTVTDRRMTRFFISPADAGHLLLCAGAMAKHGELFVLDMGEPYRIWDIAEKMIRAAGKEPGRDIEIVETGLLPGEKIFEEYLLCDAGKYKRTANDLIYVEKNCEAAPSPAFVAEKLEQLLKSEECETDNALVKKVLSEIVTDYTPLL